MVARALRHGPRLRRDAACFTAACCGLPARATGTRLHDGVTCTSATHLHKLPRMSVCWPEGWRCGLCDSVWRL